MNLLEKKRKLIEQGKSTTSESPYYNIYSLTAVGNKV